MYVINVINVQHNGGFLPDIITLENPVWGTRSSMLDSMLDCHLVEGVWYLYMIGMLDRLYWSGEELPTGSARMFTR